MSVKLGHFELHDQIGQGGMGTVFRAFDPSLNRNVAIKLLDEDMAEDPKFVEDFIREAQNAAAISHPHIVQIYFVGEDEGHYYIVMELLTGRSLSAILQEGALPEAAVLRLATEIAEALKAAYTNEMIHGDVKPQNIYLTNDNGAKLLDFGLAKLANVEVAVADGIWGSAYYVSPERVGRKAEDFRSDIYSLGATIFEALIGRPPFEAPTIEELASKRLSEKPPLLRALNPALSKRTEQIVNKMLAKSPLLRYLDYDSLINDLRKAESSLQSNAPPTETTELLRATTGQIPAITPKSQLPLIMMASVSVILAVAAVVFVVFQKKAQPIPAPVVSNTPAPGPASQPMASTASQSPAASQPATSAVAEATPLPAPFGTKIRQFMYKNPDAKSVQLTGNFDQWHPEQMVKDSRGYWSITKELPRAVILEYQYIVDGIKMPDPHQMNNVLPDGTGSLKSVYTIPKDDPAPHVAHNPHNSTPAPSASPELQIAPATMGTSTVADAQSDAVDLTSLAATPADWPKTVTLKDGGVVFPVIINGKAAGEIQATPGMQVALVKVTPDQLTIAFQGAVQTVPVSSTDLIERVQASRKH